MNLTKGAGFPAASFVDAYKNPFFPQVPLKSPVYYVKMDVS